MTNANDVARMNAKPCDTVTNSSTPKAPIMNANTSAVPSSSPSMHDNPLPPSCSGFDNPRPLVRAESNQWVARCGCTVCRFTDHLTALSMDAARGEPR